MSKSKSSQSSTTTNITETITPTAVTSDGGSAIITVAETINGIDGVSAARVIESFNKTQSQQALLNAQITTNALRVKSGGISSSNFVSPGASPANKKAGVQTSSEQKTRMAVLLLGGAAAVITIFALRK